MRVPLLAAVILVLFAGCGGGPAATAQRPATTATAAAGATAAPCAPTGGGTQVSIAESAYDPASVSVAVGGSVTWTNADSFAHTVTFDDLNCGNLGNDASVTRTFDAAGTFAYHCNIHPSMRGTVTVQ